MSIQLLFTRNSKPLSRMIIELTREPVSHVAIRIEDYVLHSSIFGPEIRTYEYFQAHNVIVYSMPLPGTHYQRLPLHVMSQIDNRGYDWGAILYLGLCYVMLRAFKIKLPKANLWEASNMYICTELVTKILGEKPDAMMTPYGLFNKLYGNIK